MCPNDFFCSLLSKLVCIVSGRFTRSDFIARQQEIMVWNSTRREIYLHIDKKTYLCYFSFNDSCFEHIISYLWLNWPNLWTVFTKLRLTVNFLWSWRNKVKVSWNIKFAVYWELCSKSILSSSTKTRLWCSWTPLHKNKDGVYFF